MVPIQSLKRQFPSHNHRGAGSFGVADYSKAIPDFEIKNLATFCKLHLAIWQLRAHDLQAMFDIDTEIGRIGFLAWCASSGRSEYKALDELSPFRDELNSPALIPATKWSAGISRVIQLAVFATPQLNINHLLLTEQEQLAALTWYFCCNGHRSFPAPGGVPSWQRLFLIDQVDLVATKFAQLVYGARPDVRAAFNLRSVSGVESFRHWMASHGLSEAGLLEDGDSNEQRIISVGEKVQPSVKPFGVNLIGYAFGELGIGEDVRMAAKSLHAAGVPFTVINYDPGHLISQNDHSIQEWVGIDFIYSINLFCLTALEHFRFYAEHGSATVTGYYCIGYWPWELQDWPLNWKHCFSLVDEIWGASEHIINSVRRAGFKNSLLMPMAVSLQDPPSSKRGLRKLLNIKGTTKAFIFSFDGNSSFKRKNPMAILAAFKVAFPNHTDDVALVIKCMRADRETAIWTHIEEFARVDNRIIIINKVMTKSEIMALYKACDCFVSLHRAEGFGRGIAEALLLDLDVITTNYSGNVDFCRPLDALLVDFELVRTSPDCYVESAENFWAEPSVVHAASLLREAASAERAEYRQKQYHQRIQKLDEIFAHEGIGLRYSNRLAQILSLTNTLSTTPNVNY